MTHVPPQFRKPQVLVDEWRRRANAFRMSDPAVAEAFAQCADELSELDVHTESATDGTPLWSQRVSSSTKHGPALAPATYSTELVGDTGVIRSGILTVTAAGGTIAVP